MLNRNFDIAYMDGVNHEDSSHLGGGDGQVEEEFTKSATLG